MKERKEKTLLDTITHHITDGIAFLIIVSTVYYIAFSGSAKQAKPLPNLSNQNPPSVQSAVAKQAKPSVLPATFDNLAGKDKIVQLATPKDSKIDSAETWWSGILNDQNEDAKLDAKPAIELSWSSVFTEEENPIVKPEPPVESSKPVKTKEKKINEPKPRSNKGHEQVHEKVNEPVEVGKQALKDEHVASASKDDEEKSNEQAIKEKPTSSQDQNILQDLFPSFFEDDFDAKIPLPDIFVNEEDVKESRKNGAKQTSDSDSWFNNMFVDPSLQEGVLALESTISKYVKSSKFHASSSADPSVITNWVYDLLPSTEYSEDSDSEGGDHLILKSLQKGMVNVFESMFPTDLDSNIVKSGSLGSPAKVEPPKIPGIAEVKNSLFSFLNKIVIDEEVDYETPRSSMFDQFDSILADADPKPVKKALKQSSTPDTHQKQTAPVLEISSPSSELDVQEQSTTLQINAIQPPKTTKAREIVTHYSLKDRLRFLIIAYVKLSKFKDPTTEAVKENLLSIMLERPEGSAPCPKSKSDSQTNQRSSAPVTEQVKPVKNAPVSTVHKDRDAPAKSPEVSLQQLLSKFNAFVENENSEETPSSKYMETVTEAINSIFNTESTRPKKLTATKPLFNTQKIANGVLGLFKSAADAVTPALADMFVPIEQ